MEIRDNIRRRRRERIVQLIGQQLPEGGAFGAASPAESRDAVGTDEAAGASGGDGAGAFTGRSEPIQPPLPGQEAYPAPVRPIPAPAAPPRTEGDAEPDPERWWKERQRRMHGADPGWAGLSGLSGKPPAGGPVRHGTGTGLGRFARGFAARLAVAGVLFGAAWGWFESGWTGGEDARSWMVAAVSQDMDFEAVGAWYERTFGGSPSFLPAFKSRGQAQAVSGAWNSKQAVVPVQGRVVRTFAQDGGGVRIAAPGGSAVMAAYAGRVLQVASDPGGTATVLLQHAGSIVTVYGNLDRPEVKAGDWVEAGARIGIVPDPLDAGGESLLYFAAKRGGKTLDPAEVVPLG